MIYFITGTDTDVGKTYATQILLAGAQAKGLSTLGVKPIAAGCQHTAHGLRNQDALILMQHSTYALPYEQVNPIAFEAAIAPHIAAMQQQESIEISTLIDAIPRSMMAQADLCLVEGAGGWLLPINDRDTLDHWVAWEGWPVILVVGMRLGCLNHALLSAQAIKASGAQLVGWVANQIDPSMSHYQANLESLQHRLEAPLLLEIPYATPVNDEALNKALRQLIGTK